MSKTKSKNSVAKVIGQRKNLNGEKVDYVVGYLSSKDEEEGLDIQLDMRGFKIVAI